MEEQTHYNIPTNVALPPIAPLAEEQWHTNGNVLTTSRKVVAAEMDLIPFQNGWASFIPLQVGYGATSTVTYARYYKFGRRIDIDIELTGTSNDVAFSFTLPYKADATSYIHAGRAQDNSAALETAIFRTIYGSPTCTILKDSGGNNWTAAGTKLVSGVFTYESQN